jgi:SAM-dependent methyltransferase
MALNECSHWTKHAQQWSYIKSPLRPCAEDVALFNDVFNSHFDSYEHNQEKTILLFGVTQELALHAWTTPLYLIGIDNNLAMIKNVWPSQTTTRQVLCGDWLNLPFRKASIDIVMGDGGLTLLSFPRTYKTLAAEIKRVLKPDGLFCIRLFVRPQKTEQLQEVFTALRNKHIRNFHIFKWRLAMALQGENSTTGVCISSVWEALHREFNDASQISTITGWPIEEINTIKVYKGSDAVYSFPSGSEVIDALANEFCFMGQKQGTYELSERCPIMVFKKRSCNEKLNHTLLFI